MAKKKKVKQKLTMQQVQILIFVLVGFILGGLIGLFYYNNLFDAYLTTMRKYIDEDWSKVEYYANRATDQVIRLKKMIEKLLADEDTAKAVSEHLNKGEEEVKDNE